MSVVDAYKHNVIKLICVTPDGDDDKAEKITVRWKFKFRFQLTRRNFAMVSI